MNGREFWAKRGQPAPVNRTEFWAAVQAEVTRARSLFPSARNMTVAMAEESGELIKADPSLGLHATLSFEGGRS